MSAQLTTRYCPELLREFTEPAQTGTGRRSVAGRPSAPATTEFPLDASYSVLEDTRWLGLDVQVSRKRCAANPW
eukprot:4138877-Pyramimonas_sp.AAC.1